MQILIEGEYYPTEKLESLFDDPKFYKVNGQEGTITSVGYYHSFSKNSLVFMLPKVFMEGDNQTVFKCNKEVLIDLIANESVKHKTEYNWVRQLSVYFYNSLIEYRRRRQQSSIIHDTETFELNTNLSEKEYSFLDLLLSFVNFYKRNRQQILFKYIEFISGQAKKPKWEKTIQKSLPVIVNGGTPIYIEISNKKKVFNTEEELIIYFFSILNKLNVEHNLNLKIDRSYQIIDGCAFERLCESGLSKLRKIKYRYFSDTLRRMYVLCEIYFTMFDKSSIRKKREDFLSISNYNLVFEDMVDKLFSDEESKLQVDGVSIDMLKHNDDGKIIDHIYDYESLIDRSNIFYIGDSKYYKSDNAIGKVSKYKQFTYAKNVIQFNIDILNKVGEQQVIPLRYLDKVTEGYNLSPNFFIQGYVNDIDNYHDSMVSKQGEPIRSFHFQDRLFDRDTLFVHQYKINFLYVLKSYTAFNNSDIGDFRKDVRKKFRDNFLIFFNDKEACGFTFFQSTLSKDKHEEFVEKNFKKLNGKCFRTIEGKLILAVNDVSLVNEEFSEYFEPMGKLY